MQTTTTYNSFRTRILNVGYEEGKQKINDVNDELVPPIANFKKVTHNSWLIRNALMYIHKVFLELID